MTLKQQGVSLQYTGLDVHNGLQTKKIEDCQARKHQTFQQADLKNLKNLDYSDGEVIRRYAEKYNQFCCEFSFANLYLWNDLYHYKMTWFNDWLVIIDPENDYCLMPLGENITPSALQNLSECLQKEGYSGDISNVPPEVIENHPELSRYYDIESYRGMAEYIYSCEKLAELKGKKLRKKRNHISQFKRKYPDYQLRTMDVVTRKDCLVMSERILEQAIKTGSDSEGIQEELIAIKTAFNTFDGIALEGLAIYAGGEDKIGKEACLAGFSIYSRLNKDVYTIHFEKFDYHYNGIAQIINQETAKALKERCTYINREQDLGIPGLRKAKLSYEPVLIYPANYLSIK